MRRMHNSGNMGTVAGISDGRIALPAQLDARLTLDWRA